MNTPLPPGAPRRTTGPAVRQGLAVGGFLGFLVVVPALLGPYYAGLVARALVLAVAGLGLNVLHLTGLVSFGHATFYGLGAYAGGFLYSFGTLTSFEAYLASGLLLVAAVAAPVGWVAVRARRGYFSILTLVLTQTVHALFTSGIVLRPFGGTGRGLFLMGSGGMYIPRFHLLGRDLPWPHYHTVLYYVVAAAFVGTLALLGLVTNSPFGQALRAIGQNEARAACIGIPVHRFRWYAFILSAVLTGLAGGLAGQLDNQVTPDQLHWMLSVQLVLVTVLGGLRQFWGPVAGALAWVAIQEAALRTTVFRGVAFGTTLVLLVLFMPGGFTGSLARRWARRQRSDGSHSIRPAGSTPAAGTSTSCGT
ncbi:MAG: branched-chain amino acid ABC transporter permease [Armatimonadota bacterium]|nr:branched-chain amino acid ABC transporter permease [Armatimonadota bacterium]MDR7534707.1 branched-chain amino acid ABC transporter permease [Armatimonadota bacterium]MDR7534949.1 branched-chain amino acid ABC transporter permease [Armatimonadota bacterium]